MSELFASIIGGVIALLGSMSVLWYQTRLEKKSIANAFSGEIESLLILIEKRNYKNSLERWLELAKENKKLPQRSHVALPKYNYFSIYEANTNKIGFLPSNASVFVTKFYTLSMSLLEDLTNEELFSRSNGEVIDAINEDIELLAEIKKLGHTAIKKLK